MVASIKVEASAQEYDKWITQRTVGQRVMQNWDCSQIEHEEEEQEEGWQEGDQNAAQWDEEQKLEEILERRRMEGSSLKLEVMQNLTHVTRYRGEESQRQKESDKMVH